MIHISNRLTCIGLAAAVVLLPACGRRDRSSIDLRTRSKKQTIAGSVVAATAGGAAVAAGTLMAHHGSDWGNLVHFFVGSCIFLPIAVITAPIAIALLVYGSQNRKEAEKEEALETAQFYQDQEDTTGYVQEA